MNPPTTIHVAWCPGCGTPALVKLKAKDAQIDCFVCPQRTGVLPIARYRLIPPKKRTGRKPRRNRR